MENYDELSVIETDSYLLWLPKIIFDPQPFFSRSVLIIQNIAVRDSQRPQFSFSIDLEVDSKFRFTIHTGITSSYI